MEAASKKEEGINDKEKPATNNKEVNGLFLFNNIDANNALGNFYMCDQSNEEICYEISNSVYDDVNDIGNEISGQPRKNDSGTEDGNEGSAENNEELPDISQTEEERRKEQRERRDFSFMVSNARSLLPKIQSLLENFSELNVGFAMISETWLRDNSDNKHLTIDLKQGHGLSIIQKNRYKTKSGALVRGGGVAIIFDNAKINLKEYPIKKTRHEIIVATGKIPKVHRKMALICVYIPHFAHNSWRRQKKKYDGE